MIQKGSDVFKLVDLYIDGELFGTIDVPKHSSIMQMTLLKIGRTES